MNDQRKIEAQGSIVKPVAAPESRAVNSALAIIFEAEGGDYQAAPVVPERPVVGAALTFIFAQEGQNYWSKSDPTDALIEDLIAALSEDSPHAAVIRLAEIKTWSVAGSYGSLSADRQLAMHEIIIGASKDGADFELPGYGYLTKSDQIKELMEARRGKCEDLGNIQSNVWLNAALEKTKFRDLSDAYKQTIGIQECENRHRTLTQEGMR